MSCDLLLYCHYNTCIKNSKPPRISSMKRSICLCFCNAKLYNKKNEIFHLCITLSSSECTTVSSVVKHKTNPSHAVGTNRNSIVVSVINRLLRNTRPTTSRESTGKIGESQLYTTHVKPPRLIQSRLLEVMTTQ